MINWTQSSASGSVAKWGTFDFPKVTFPLAFTSVYRVTTSGSRKVIVISVNTLTTADITMSGKSVYGDGDTTKGIAYCIAIGKKS